ncbi:MAG TPA: PhaM family polyhydroxyalkanoate granule multifunctional regulatory protein [Burkholderiales bacterium]|nr:PhaM family polyhydroxyalkanoate granule multifunctional regulatory protein [Burkholderiales bacterium]
MAEQDLPKDLFEFMQKMWNPMSFPFPGVMTPTIDPNEIEKKIVELRTVESWLKMNLGFVDMTIKTLELQKAAFESLASGGQSKNGSD